MSKVNNRHNINFYQSIIQRNAFCFWHFFLYEIFCCALKFLFFHFIALNTLVGFRERRKICTHTVGAVKLNLMIQIFNVTFEIGGMVSVRYSSYFILHTFYTFILYTSCNSIFYLFFSLFSSFFLKSKLIFRLFLYMKQKQQNNTKLFVEHSNIVYLAFAICHAVRYFIVRSHVVRCSNAGCFIYLRFFTN